MTLFCLKSRDTRLSESEFLKWGRNEKIDKPVIFYNFTLTQLPQEIFIVSDDDQLEVGMVLAFVDNTDRKEYV